MADIQPGCCISCKKIIEPDKDDIYRFYFRTDADKCTPLVTIPVAKYTPEESMLCCGCMDALCAFRNEPRCVHCKRFLPTHTYILGCYFRYNTYGKYCATCYSNTTIAYHNILNFEPPTINDHTILGIGVFAALLLVMINSNRT